MSQHTEVDVVIVGYGPVGQYLSFKLGRLGWTSVCIERFPSVYASPRAVHFDDEIARLFQSVGLDPATNPAVHPFDQLYRWRNADREILLELDWRGLGPSGFLRNYFFYQPDLEREISAIVATESRARVLRGWEAVEVAQDDGGATVLARPFEAGREAETQTFRCRYVVGADGANSYVRSQMDVTTTDLGFEYDWLIVDMLLHEPLDLEARAWQWCRPERPTTTTRRSPASSAVGVHAASRGDARRAQLGRDGVAPGRRVRPDPGERGPRTARGVHPSEALVRPVARRATVARR